VDLSLFKVQSKIIVRYQVDGVRRNVPLTVEPTGT
jgi:hypothetical protein